MLLNTRDWEKYVAHKKATASALKAAWWGHLNGILVLTHGLTCMECKWQQWKIAVI